MISSPTHHIYTGPWIEVADPQIPIIHEYCMKEWTQKSNKIQIHLNHSFRLARAKHPNAVLTFATGKEENFTRIETSSYWSRSNLWLQLHIAPKYIRKALNVIWINFRTLMKEGSESTLDIRLAFPSALPGHGPWNKQNQPKTHICTKFHFLDTAKPGPAYQFANSCKIWRRSW